MEAIASAISALVEAINALTKWLADQLKSLVDWFLGLFKFAIKWVSDFAVAVFKAAWDMLTDLVCWCLDKLLDVVVQAANSLDLSGLTGFAPSSELPAEIINVMQLCGVGTAVGIISAAIVIRLILQLIPFVRLGS